MSEPTAKELLIRAVTLVSAPRDPDGPSFEAALRHLERSTPLERVGFAAQGCKLWADIVEQMVSDSVRHGGLPPGKGTELFQRACASVRAFTDAFDATLRELTP